MDNIKIWSWVYLESEPRLWTVGFYDPNGEWHPESDHSDREEAAKRVHYLNGGRQEDEARDPREDDDALYQRWCER